VGLSLFSAGFLIQPAGFVLSNRNKTGLSVSNGAIFLMDPQTAVDSTTPVIAQLTIASDLSWYASVNVQGKSVCPAGQATCPDFKSLAAIWLGNGNGTNHLDECHEALLSLCGPPPTSKAGSSACADCAGTKEPEIRAAKCSSKEAHAFCTWKPH
jgi:hypothetical protein